jgi:hypothetical protein
LPFVKIPSETHKGMKHYIADIEGMTLGEIVDAAFSFAMQNLEDFENFLELDQPAQAEDGSEEQGQEIDEEEEKS